LILRVVLFLIVVVLAGEGGNLAITHAMKRLGEVKRFSPWHLAGVLGQVFRQGWTWIGVSMLALAFFSLLALLSLADVSFVVPATASSYIVGALGARFLLGEQVSPMRWAGVLLVCLGVGLVCAG
jgi:drug/metabolite transporter (DMT)-like permease